ncbi:UNVERIFIED_CONTAM: hypothetical protein K2H54_015597 [Gekko kuhli]
MRRAATAPGSSVLLPLVLLLLLPPLGVSLACHSPGPRALQEQASSAAVVLEGKVQALAAAAGPGPGNGSSGEEAPPSPAPSSPAGAGALLVKVLEVWPLRSGGLRREQLIRVGAPAAPCFQARRNRRYIFFLEPTEQPLLFAPAFAPLDASGRRSPKKDVARVLCADCDVILYWLEDAVLL